jgi:hypothetical protein
VRTGERLLWRITVAYATVASRLLPTGAGAQTLPVAFSHLYRRAVRTALEVLSQHSTALLFIDLQVKTLPRILRQETSVTLVVFFLGGTVVSEVHLHITLFGGFYATPTFWSSSFTFVQDIWGLVFTRGRHTPAGSHVVGILQQVWTMKSAWDRDLSLDLLFYFLTLFHHTVECGQNTMNLY